MLPRWPGVGFGAAPFSALDYFVLMPNPRGSYGQGEAFTAANRKDFGDGDLRDILGRSRCGRPTLTVRPPARWHHRLDLWRVHDHVRGHPDARFRAAVAGAGIANWHSYYGENSIDQWMIPFFGASVYDDPAVYAKSSAINFINQVKTPTLVFVGDRDGECPAPQSFEFWHALRTQHVPTQLVVYPTKAITSSTPDASETSSRARWHRFRSTCRRVESGWNDVLNRSRLGPDCGVTAPFGPSSMQSAGASSRVSTAPDEVRLAPLAGYSLLTQWLSKSGMPVSSRASPFQKNISHRITGAGLSVH